MPSDSRALWPAVVKVMEAQGRHPDEAIPIGLRLRRKSTENSPKLWVSCKCALKEPIQRRKLKKNMEEDLDGLETPHLKASPLTKRSLHRNDSWFPLWLKTSFMGGVHSPHFIEVSTQGYLEAPTVPERVHSYLPNGFLSMNPSHHALLCGSL